MFSSVLEVLKFLDDAVYSNGVKEHYRLDPSLLGQEEIHCLVQAMELGFITVVRCTDVGFASYFNVAFTPEGIIEFLFTPKIEKLLVSDPKGAIGASLQYRSRPYLMRAYR